MIRISLHCDKLSVSKAFITTLQLGDVAHWLRTYLAHMRPWDRTTASQENKKEIKILNTKKCYKDGCLLVK